MKLAVSVRCLACAAAVVMCGTSAAQTTTIYVSQTPGGKLPVYTDSPVDEGSRQLIAMPTAQRRAVRQVGGTRNNYTAATRRFDSTNDDVITPVRAVDTVSDDGYTIASSRSNGRRSALMPVISRTAQALGVDQALLQALIEVESGFNPGARSPKGAVGLMQVMPATAARYGRFDLTVPEQNVEVGTRYLRDLLALFKGDVSLAVAAYNAGEYAVIKYGNRVPPFAETQRYVPMVLSRYRFYVLRGTDW